MQSVAWNYRVGKATVHCVVKETCEVLWSVLVPLVLKVPNEREWNDIIKGFYER